jgi:hypothetical protein
MRHHPRLNQIPARSRAGTVLRILLIFSAALVFRIGNVFCIFRTMRKPAPFRNDIPARVVRSYAQILFCDSELIADSDRQIDEAAPRAGSGFGNNIFYVTREIWTLFVCRNYQQRAVV